mmetsp:Transcript_93065/g.221309  ORF Transcript_93065/g.221309 Transcript_93065/m.221309 type:complete len:320 (-) Transcript_93065:143-1102(-)
MGCLHKAARPRLWPWTGKGATAGCPAPRHLEPRSRDQTLPPPRARRGPASELEPWPPWPARSRLSGPSPPPGRCLHLGCRSGRPHSQRCRRAFGPFADACDPPAQGSAPGEGLCVCCDTSSAKCPRSLQSSLGSSRRSCKELLGPLRCDPREFPHRSSYPARSKPSAFGAPALHKASSTLHRTGRPLRCPFALAADRFGRSHTRTRSSSRGKDAGGASRRSPAHRSPSLSVQKAPAGIPRPSHAAATPRSAGRWRHTLLSQPRRPRRPPCRAETRRCADPGWSTPPRQILGLSGSRRGPRDPRGTPSRWHPGRAGPAAP